MKLLVKIWVITTLAIILALIGVEYDSESGLTELSCIEDLDSVETETYEIYFYDVDRNIKTGLSFDGII